MNHKSLWSIEEQLVLIELDSVSLKAELIIPENASGIVVMASATGSNRYSPRNYYLAHMLRQAGLATILIDLLTKEEEMLDLRTQHFRCNSKFMATRLVEATDWLVENPLTRKLKVGYFGDGVGGGAALIAAAERPICVGAIVSRSGQIWADEALSYVQAATLLIVGGYDFPVIAMNEDVLAQIPSVNKQLEIIPGATHQFGEPGAMSEVARLASLWFQHYLTPVQPKNLHVYAMSAC